MQHLGLFEGIGGFSLAARWAGWQTPVMVEWNPYCQAVLKKNFPDATIFGDIKQFDGRPYAGQIDIITGGFPCQPFSHAGKRAGTDDDRYLWPEMLRVIREVAPAWVVGENVSGLLTMDGGRVFAGILADLENAGYRTEIFVIPAIAVGAPHLRNRVWIIANRNDNDSAISKQPKKRWLKSKSFNASGENSRAASDADLQRCGPLQFAEKPGFATFGTRCIDAAASDTCPGRCVQAYEQNDVCGRESDTHKQDWSEHWYEVATRICRMDDGISAGMDGTGNIPIKTQKGKAHRLEALGNAIVPQIAFQIFDAINKF